MIRLGSLCSGAGMLDRAVEALFTATPVWHAETDKAAAKVLAAHWPDVPNLGDITAIDWATADRVDVLAAGFPCQGFSLAGKRGGSSDERHLWPVGVLPGIEALMPPVVVLENVPGLLTIERGAVFATVLADLDKLGYTTAWAVVGACRVGACHHRHRLFVLAVRSDRVTVPVSEPVAVRTGDVWAPAQQVLFGDTDAVRWPEAGVARGGQVWPLQQVEKCGANGVVLPTPTAVRYGSNQSPSPGAAVRPSLDAIASMLPTPTARIAAKRGTPSAVTAAQRMGEGRRNLEDAVALLPTPRVSAVRTSRSAMLNSASSPSLQQALEIAAGVLPRELESWDEAPASWQALPTPRARDGKGRDANPRGIDLNEAVARLLPTPRASDTGTPGRRASDGWRPPLSQVLLPTVRTSDVRGPGVHGDGGADLRTAVGSMLPTLRASDAAKGGPNQRGSSGDVMLPAAVQPGRFGVYGVAIARHERAFGIAVPEPTEPGKNGQLRLAAPFCEWLMGLPPGWVTGVVSRSDAIRICGNGVVAQAVVHALPQLPTFGTAVELLAAVAVDEQLEAAA